MLGGIKSPNVLKLVFDYIKNRTKLKIIKHNKIIQNKINITLEDFKVYKYLKEFKKKYLIKINDIDIKELAINNMEIRNQVEIFNKINFKELQKLDLSWNKINNINNLENLENLRELNLGNNEIIKLDVLERAKFNK